MAAGPLACQVEGCQEHTNIQMGLRVHFLFRHMQDNMVIVADEPPPYTHTRFLQHDMLVPRSTLNNRYLNIANPAKGPEGKQHRMDA